MIKFLCKDMWTLVFRKQIDNLKTNHRVCLVRSPFGTGHENLQDIQGVYVLTDNGFKPFTRMSLASSSEAVAKAQPVSIGARQIRSATFLLTQRAAPLVSMRCYQGQSGKHGYHSNSAG